MTVDLMVHAVNPLWNSLYGMTKSDSTNFMTLVKYMRKMDYYINEGINDIYAIILYFASI